MTVLGAARSLARAGLLLAPLIVLAAPYPVLAGGFTIPLIGARMSGQGAFQAHPDDTTSIYHNPAGLILRPGLRLDLSGTGILTNTAYRRVDYPEQAGVTPGPGEPVPFDTRQPPSGLCPEESDSPVSSACYRPEAEPASKWGAIPFFGAAYQLTSIPLAFGLGLYSPHNATADFPEEGAQRFQVISGSITTVYMTPAVAYLPHPALAIGGGASLIQAQAQYRRQYWLPALLSPEAVVLDLQADGLSFGWGAGLLLRFGQLHPALGGLELGVSYQSRSTLDFDGQLDLTGANSTVGAELEEGFVDGQTISRNASAQFTVPDMLRIGLGYDFGPRGWIGADLYWSHYSLYDKLTIRLDQPLKSGIDRFEDPKHSEDCWSLAVGGRYSPLELLDLRLGLFLDQTPYPDAYYSLLSPDADKLGLTAGLSLRFGLGLEVALSYMALWYADRKVDSSAVRPNVELYGSKIWAPFSNNGEVVDKLVHILGVQLAWSWGA